MRRDLIIGILISLLVHGGVAWVGEITKAGPDTHKAKAAASTIQVIEMPPIPPDEPDVVDENQQQQQAADFAPPMQNDVPSMVTDTSFVQQLQPPPPQNMQINKGAIVVPQNTGTWGKGIEVFDVSKLDQQPVPTVQVKPQYPFEMRRAGISGQVVVDFILDTTGVVRNAYAISSTQREFESAAVQAVSKWRFKPGKKGGRTVNTHMQVPIVFSLNADEN